MEMRKLEENSKFNQDFMAQSNKIDELERNNRALKTEADYLKFAN